jgi:hypothetical protein
MSLTYAKTGDLVDRSPALAFPSPPKPETPATLALPESVRPVTHADPTPGTAVELVGIIEAVAVCDGQFTPVLRCAKFPRAITLVFTQQMRKQALDNLCRRVAVGGRLYSSEADPYWLEVHTLRAAHRIDDVEQR